MCDTKTYKINELAALSKLPADVVERLSMFGLIEAREGLYGFHNLAAGRQVDPKYGPLASSDVYRESTAAVFCRMALSRWLVRPQRRCSTGQRRPLS